MIFHLRRLINLSLYALYSRAWAVVLYMMLGIYFAGYALMVFSAETEIVNNYSWWFFVTATTVGYGDYAPATMSGRFAAVCIMLLGIGALTLVIAKITELVLKIVNKRSKGLAVMKLQGHTIIMGYRKGSTEKIVEEILSNDRAECIVLCSSEQESNPLYGTTVEYIRGELASKDVMNRSAAEHAAKIIIYGSDDNQTFFTAYAFREINQTAHLVCYLLDEDHVNKIYNLPAKESYLNQVILPVNVYLMAQELQDPESSNVFQHLISNLNGATLFRIDVPYNLDKVWLFEDLFIAFKKQHKATVLAIKDTSIISNPDMEETVSAGMAIFYIAAKRLDKIDWSLV
ncbi:MAG: ion channel [Gammaproteobacteria bacterium]|nr:ion channel [Gammaproteobacteria bacterium]